MLRVPFQLTLMIFLSYGRFMNIKAIFKMNVNVIRKNRRPEVGL